MILNLLKKLRMLTLILLIRSGWCGAHHTYNQWEGVKMSSKGLIHQYGVMVSFQNPVYSNGYFLGFEGWESVMQRYGSGNVSFVIRLDLDRIGLKDNRVKKHFRRFFLPGVYWVERSIVSQHIHKSNLSLARVRNQSSIDLWIDPYCFIRHHGMTRVHRIAKTLRLKIAQIKWMAKIYFSADDSYGPKELVEIGKALIEVAGIQCAWIHPSIPSSLMVRFFKGDVPSRYFFSPSKGYHNWKFLNDEYQVVTIRFVKHWSRALLDFQGGLTCQENHAQIAAKYQLLPGIRSVYLDNLDDCQFSYQIVIAFDKKIMDPQSVKVYQHWNNLNHIYGVINIDHKYAHELKSILEFEAGLYSHHQMKAIRDEYLKLPGIKFGWVTGKQAEEVSTIIVSFSRDYLRRVPLKQYHFWDGLNKKFSTNITILEEARARAFIRFPKGRFADLELKAILRRYRQLPGIISVQMDVDESLVRYDDKENMTSSLSLLNDLPPQRSLDSWMRLSNSAFSNFLPKDEVKTLDNKSLKGTQYHSACIPHNKF